MSQSFTNTENGGQKQYILYPVSEQNQNTPMNSNNNYQNNISNQTPFSNEQITPENINQLQTPPQKISNAQNNRCNNCLGYISVCIYFICGIGLCLLLLYFFDQLGLPVGDNDASYMN